jgi:hypothetical protein
MRRIKIPLVVGNGIEVLGICLALFLLIAGGEANSILARFIVYVVSWACLVFFPHCLGHFIVGRLVGIRFTHYSLGRSAIMKLRLPIISRLGAVVPLLTLNIDRASLDSASENGRAAMFTAGMAASTILPFAVALISVGRLPTILATMLLLLSAGNLGFDLYYSPKAGDIHRIKRIS